MTTSFKKIESLYLSMREWIKNDFARVVFENEFEAIRREMEETTLSSEDGPVLRQIIPRNSRNGCLPTWRGHNIRINAILCTRAHPMSYAFTLINPNFRKMKQPNART